MHEPKPIAEASPWKRRGFVAGMLLATGAAAGWLTRQWSGVERLTSRQRESRQPAFDYDLSEFEATDPSLLLYEPANAFATNFERVKAILAWPDSTLAVAGDESVRFHDENGEVRRTITLGRPPHCLGRLDRETLVIGFEDRYAVWHRNGQEMFRSPPLGDRTYLTSVAGHGPLLFAADAGNREVIVCNRETGRVEARFGKKDRALGHPGFNVPSPYFDLAVAPDGRLRVVNPGLLRVETYTLDGRFLGAWGGPGMRIDRFCGCCNPVYFTMTPTGEFITSEKGLARINLYAADGTFRGAVAGPETLVADKALAKRACRDCRIGAGFDVAWSQDGSVWALDPFQKSVRRFRPKHDGT